MLLADDQYAVDEVHDCERRALVQALRPHRDVSTTVDPTCARTQDARASERRRENGDRWGVHEAATDRAG